MKIEDKRTSDKEVRVDRLFAGDPFLYQGFTCIKTDTTRMLPGGVMTISIIRLVNGTIDEIRADTIVYKINAKVIIES